MTETGRDQNMFCSVSRVSKRWRSSRIHTKLAPSLSPTQRLCMPFIQHLDNLEVSAYEGILYSSDLIPTSQKHSGFVTTSSERSSGQDSPNSWRSSFYRPSEDAIYWMTRMRSYIRYLRELRIDSLPNFIPDGPQLIKSKKLCHVAVSCGDSYGGRNHTITISLLKLFVECTIDCTELRDAPKPTLEKLVKLFPGLKQFIHVHVYVSCFVSKDIMIIFKFSSQPVPPSTRSEKIFLHLVQMGNLFSLALNNWCSWRMIMEMKMKNESRSSELLIFEQGHQESFHLKGLMFMRSTTTVLVCLGFSLEELEEYVPFV